MDNRLTPEEENIMIEDALKKYPLTPMPHSITVNVMTRIQKDVHPKLVTWNDLVLSLVFGICIGTLFFTAQNLPPILLAKLRIQGILLYHDLLVNARWLNPTTIIGITAFLSLLLIPYFFYIKSDDRR